MLKTINPMRTAGLAALLLTSLVVAACGGSSTSTTASNSTTTTSESTSLATSTNQATSSVSTPRPNYAAYKAALVNYAACMRRHGVDLEPPKEGPSGLPLLSTPKNMSPKSSQFSAALLQCRPYVIQITKVSPSGALG